MYHCKEAQNNNAIIIRNNGRFDVYSKVYNLCDKSPDEPQDENWVMELRLKDVRYCPYCGKSL